MICQLAGFLIKYAEETRPEDTELIEHEEDAHMVRHQEPGSVEQ